MLFRSSVSVNDPVVRSDGTIANAVSPAVLDAEGVTWKSAVGATCVYDDLDNPIKPTKGFRGRIAPAR